MAGEIQVTADSGLTLYVLIRNRTGSIWDTVDTAFEAYATAQLANYVISLTEQGTASGYYTGTFPSDIPAGIYSVVAKEAVSGSGNEAETDPTVGQGDLQWNGSVTLPLSDLATSGQIGDIAPIRVARGTMVKNFPIYMKSAADHVTPLTSGIISGQISRDGGSFGALQSGAFTEMGNGYYKVQALTSGDLSAEVVSLLFTGVGISGGSRRSLCPCPLCCNERRGIDDYHILQF